MITRGQTITFDRTIPFTWEVETITARVVGFNYSFETLTGVYVDTTPEVVWLDQIR